MNWLATVLAKVFREWLGFEKEQQERPKTVENAQTDQSTKDQWEEYVRRNGIVRDNPPPTRVFTPGQEPKDRDPYRP